MMLFSSKVRFFIIIIIIIIIVIIIILKVNFLIVIMRLDFYSLWFTLFKHVISTAYFVILDVTLV